MARPFDLISFDFDGVLLHNDFNDRFLAHCRDAGLTWRTEQERRLARFIHDYYGSGVATREIERIGREQFWHHTNRRFLETLEAEGDLDAAVPTLTERLRASEVSYFHEEGLHELLQGLHADGYRLAMLTNRDERIRELAHEWGLREPFEFIGTRETVGKAKPEPEGFHHLSQWFAIPAARALHVGDNPYADVVGARAAGWRCVLVDPTDLFPDWDVPRLRGLSELRGWLAAQGGA